MKTYFKFFLDVSFHGNNILPMKSSLTNVTGPGVVPVRGQPAAACSHTTPHRVQARAPVILRAAALTPALVLQTIHRFHNHEEGAYQGLFLVESTN